MSRTETKEAHTQTEWSEKPSLWNEIWKNRVLYLFISPFFILFMIFGLFPILFSLYLSFHSWSGLGEMTFIGLAQFQYLITEPTFWRSVGNTFAIWFLSSVPMLFLALIIAFLLNLPTLSMRGTYRTMFFITNVTSIVAVAIIFETIFSNQYGLLNYLFSLVGIPQLEWMNSSFLIKVVIASMVVWRYVGYNAIIYLAGLQSIPKSLYEAAIIDGANKIQIFFRITIPLLRPIILFTVIMTTIGSMQIFTEPQVLLGNSGGVGGAGMTMTLYMYNEGFLNSQFGYASAVSWVMFIIIGLFSLINWKLVQRA
ncbi:sugar ABC transporter permease [Alkalicoccobacillus porphyridii]|uniref:Sugar ABC transporter permease n=2 Tax=Alkalicoccobacillus porphyridii TaxID=2597270 RepID=A0A553ZUX8_9BACI|nr:sugar ABC transporter permease [Alkalicoccobacillus porphyridii]TSB45116.1 sugar ABC transporter permease [Alkalicoccobacillus porphyridii]